MINNSERSYASLSSGLLARKGAARPAMKPQGYGQSHGFDDLGWNDMGSHVPPPVEELGTQLDDDLRQVFAAEGIGTDAATLLWNHRKDVMNAVSNYAGSRMYVVKAIIDNVTGRLRALGLRSHSGREISAMATITALISTLVHNFLSTGHLLPQSA